ncbi:discoidin, CUB and LCCL domain-containing protein 2-like [Dreissena polymorpha]|uniref:F5/8 type C domain-containing protein n=1 Tax=Dreissena polymorpha TaxID=45954 RepID=A0A9D3YK48_DREPO|nr:discoidin, CUB and LCCL domain-containing protein 2-like [Dreissena polymorpha]KAH3701466.1 hypothetical protein DPMN_076454 [Dreissena polymorpha]
MNQLTVSISLVMTVLCHNALAICDNDLVTSFLASVKASSTFDLTDKSTNYGPDRAFINATEVKDASGITQMGAWVAEKNAINQWIQIELQDPALVRGIVTQGRDAQDQQWVTKYRILYSEDCHTWHTLGAFNITDKFFTGNTDASSPVTNMFDCPIMAKCIRVNPLGWNKDIAMRVGLLGCPLNLQAVTTAAPTTVAPTTAAPTTAAPTTAAPVTTATMTTPMPPVTSTVQMATTPMPTQAAITLPPVGPKKGQCITSCLGRANGDYQSCTGCDVYITCVWSSMYANRPCPKMQQWDDNLKRCDIKSTTCP